MGDEGWYFTKGQLQKTPSVTEGGMPQNQVASILDTASKFLHECGMKLRLPQLTIATAAVLFYRFFAVHSLKKFDGFIVAGTCLFLAGKVEETPKKLRDVVKTSWEEDPRRKPGEKKDGLKEQSKEFWDCKDKFLVYEREVLRTIAFNMSVTHPYTYMLDHAKRNCANKQLAHIGWNFINDSLKTNLCLQYAPQVIGIAALFLAARVLRTPLPGPPKEKQHWYEKLGVKKAQLDDISDQILERYDTKHGPLQGVKLKAARSAKSPEFLEASRRSRSTPIGGKTRGHHGKDNSRRKRPRQPPPPPKGPPPPPRNPPPRPPQAAAPPPPPRGRAPPPPGPPKKKAKPPPPPPPIRNGSIGGKHNADAAAH